VEACTGADRESRNEALPRAATEEPVRNTKAFKALLTQLEEKCFELAHETLPEYRQAYTKERDRLHAQIIKMFQEAR
jgi:hypothetical protein